MSRSIEGLERRISDLEAAEKPKTGAVFRNLALLSPQGQKIVLSLVAAIFAISQAWGIWIYEDIDDRLTTIERDLATIKGNRFDATQGAEIWKAIAAHEQEPWHRMMDQRVKVAEEALAGLRQELKESHLGERAQLDRIERKLDAFEKRR